MAPHMALVLHQQDWSSDWPPAHGLRLDPLETMQEVPSIHDETILQLMSRLTLTLEGTIAHCCVSSTLLLGPNVVWVSIDATMAFAVSSSSSPVKSITEFGRAALIIK